MKTQDTIAGSYYGITSPNGCTVTDELGKLKKTVEAGDQLTVQAPGAKLIVDDDEAVIIKAPFKRAALALGLFGGGVKIDLDKYAHCVTVADLQAVNADYKNDLTASGGWLYKLPAINNLSSGFEASNVTRFAVELPELTAMPNGFKNSKIKFFKSALPKQNSAATSGAFDGCKELEVFDCDISKTTVMFRNFTGCYKLRVFTSRIPLVGSCYMAFSGTQLDKASTLRILTSIGSPFKDTTRTTLNIGIHVDLETDEDVINAIAEAEAKGWKLSIQWRGTATAQAASTWGRRKPVYAKLGAPMEDGTPMLDWGHYVTDPSGYTEFASLEEAKEHFNITD